jgi:hypothetical protein
MSLSVGRTIVVAAAGLLWVYATSTAAANLVTNPDFDSNLNGWTVVSSGTPTFTLDNSTGDPAAPSAHIVADAAGADVYSDCIVIDSSQNVDFTINYKAASVDIVLVLPFNNASCSPPEPVPVQEITLVPNNWTGASDLNFALPLGTQSVQIELQLFGSSDINFDHVQFGPTSTTPVRLQAFDVD